MVRPEKVKQVKELDEIFSKAQSICLADFTGMSVEMTNELRKKFIENDVQYKVIKNTLAKRALEEKKFKEISELFQGPTAIAYSYEHPIIPSKVMVEFADENDLPSLKGAVIEGKIYDIEKIKEIAKIPSKEELLSKMMGSLKSPINGLVFVLNGVIRNLVNVLDAIEKSKDKEQ